jgi:outer membrane protein OmpA-like peptidoglycan-associated protein
MPASPIDSGYVLPLHEADRPADATPDMASGKETKPKARTRRPRPTFDDGSVTRVFKFPSKAYPRSSYYVTSTEIIIRIKKARKKWKLVVPKKRMVATNRWFAKPRWVEIELTYTQALKLGLVEPRTPAPEITSGTSAEERVATQSSVDGGHILTGGSGSHPEPDSTSTRQNVSQLDHTFEQAERFDTEHVDFASDDDHLEEDTVIPGSHQHEGSQVRLLPTLPTTHADIRSSQRMSAAVARAGTERMAFRAGAALLLIASSVVVLLSGAAGWVRLGGPSTAPMTAELVCAFSEQSSSCTQTIVTGAIGKAEQPQTREPEPSATFATHASSESIPAIEQFQLSAPEIATTPAEHEDGSAKVGNSRENGSERTGAADAAAEGDPLPAATSSKTTLLAPQNAPADRRDCRELGAASQSIRITFDYASSGLKKAILPALDAFAGSLRSCPSTKVTIEGHTDSDGRAASNQSLSVRRAKAVLEHLVHAGVSPGQLSAIGFGQSRPHAPNVSTQNKRSNRRVALVVHVRG